MKILVTGGTGFVGSYLCDHLHDKGYDVVATTIDDNCFNVPFETNSLKIVAMDIRNQAAITRVLKDEKPNFIFHLAALTFVPDSLKKPLNTYAANVMGTLNLLAVVKDLDWDPRIILVSSSTVYGDAGKKPISEKQPTDPDTPYATSKRTMELLAGQYIKHYDMDIVIVRSFSSIGIGQSERFVIASFANQIAAIDAGRQKAVMHVGNLTAVRDFTDVRDTVVAYQMLLQNAKSGATYNICSGVGVSIKECLNHLRKCTNKKITVVGDKALFRPVDVPVFVGDPIRAKIDLGWDPIYNIERTLADIYDYYRQAY